MSSMLYIHCHPLFPTALQIWTPFWWGGLPVAAACRYPGGPLGTDGGLMVMGGAEHQERLSWECLV